MLQAPAVFTRTGRALTDMKMGRRYGGGSCGTLEKLAHPVADGHVRLVQEEGLRRLRAPGQGRDGRGRGRQAGRRCRCRRCRPSAGRPLLLLQDLLRGSGRPRRATRGPRGTGTRARLGHLRRERLYSDRTAIASPKPPRIMEACEHLPLWTVTAVRWRHLGNWARV